MDSSEDDEINVYLKVIKTVALKVKRSETTKRLKALFHEKEGTPGNLLDLFFTGKQLKDDHKLVDYGIRSNSTLHLYLQAIEMIKLLVYIPSNEKTIELEAKTNETVENIKLLIQTKEGIISDQFTLFYKGELLEDNRTLTSLGPQGNSSEYGAEDLTYAGKLLEDSKTLACCKIKENSLLEMLPLTFKIFVKGSIGEAQVLKVCKGDRVLDVKKKISDKEGMPVNNIRLIFSGKQLVNDQDLATCNVEKDSFLCESLEMFELFWWALSKIGFFKCVADFAVKKRDRDGSLEELQACFSISGMEMEHDFFFFVQWAYYK
ncbi:hypothetical protein RHSIM_Rhsim02G0040800 [Rhododendron simsii]|uniref:Ubiquitin-like domain-containing protein n=1 Tax=Rhododendron simsii TaxID=118357 RepID=A0A834HB34_RHOSS|nr:hypothetical protein RHSIM_Rhsim02G0040800 [Rhododendron simsii]